MQLISLLILTLEQLDFMKLLSLTTCNHMPDSIAVIAGHISPDLGESGSAALTRAGQHLLYLAYCLNQDCGDDITRLSCINFGSVVQFHQCYWT